MPANIHQALQSHLIGVTAISDLVGTRIYPDKAPTSATFPYITYGVISNTHVRHFDDISGLASPLIQIDVWSNTRLSAVTVAEEIRVELENKRAGIGPTGNQLSVSGIFLENDRDLYEPPEDSSQVGIYRVSMDFRVWHAEPTTSAAL